MNKISSIYEVIKRTDGSSYNFPSSHSVTYERMVAKVQELVDAVNKLIEKYEKKNKI